MIDNENENEEGVPYIETKIIDIQKVKRELMATVLNDPRLLEDGPGANLTSEKLTWQQVTKVFSLNKK